MLGYLFPMPTACMVVMQSQKGIFRQFDWAPTIWAKSLVENDKNFRHIRLLVLQLAAHPITEIEQPLQLSTPCIVDRFGQLIVPVQKNRLVVIQSHVVSNVQFI